MTTANNAAAPVDMYELLFAVVCDACGARTYYPDDGWAQPPTECDECGAPLGRDDP